MKLQEKMMTNDLYPAASAELSRKRRELAPDAAGAFAEFSKQVFADGALPAKTKQIIAVAVAHVTQCPYCIRGHTRGALRAGASASAAAFIASNAAKALVESPRRSAMLPTRCSRRIG